jgi:ComF family protein
MLLKQALSSFSHLFFPHVCVGCGNDIAGEQIICMHCESQMPFTNFCQQPDNALEKRFWGRLPLKAAASVFYFTKGSQLQNMLHALKYKGNKEIGYYLGRQMARQIKDCHRFKDIDALVPLPLFAARERKRGYNQATILCDAISNELKIPVNEHAVKRLSATETQTHKSREERWENMEGKFFLENAESLQHKNILLLDDVITTGATLEACGVELLKAEGAQLSILSLAFAVDE